MQCTLRLLCAAVLAAIVVPVLAQDPVPPQKLSYPAAHRDNTVDTYVGTKVPAPYQWMDNLTSPQLRAWVDAENKLTDDYLAKIPVRGWINHRLI